MKNLIRAYRVEHMDGQGPYSPPLDTEDDGLWKLAKKLGKAHNSSRPMPPGSGFRSEGEGKCACKDLKQLRKWFEGFWGDLRELGYMLVEIEGRPLWQGETWSQCILSDIVVIKDLSDTMDEFAKAKS